MTSMKVSKLTGSFAVYGLALAGLFLAGCSGPKYAEIPGVGRGQPAGVTSSGAAVPAQTVSNVQPTAGTVQPTPGNPPQTAIDFIRVGDTLTVTFADLPYRQEPIDDRVRDDGTIMLLQNLSFKAAGRTRGDLEKEIRAKYVPEFFKTLTVTVTPKAQTQFFYVDGEVKRPDRQVYIGRLRLTQAIASANGFTDFARKSAIELTRVDGRKQTINYQKASKDPSLDPEILPGDKIWVPRRNPIW